MHLITVGIVGFGYWGPNVARNFAEHQGVSISWICDCEDECLQSVKHRFSGCKVGHDFESLLTNNPVDAVVICTPVDTHFRLAMRAIEAGCHVLVEKPMASNSAEATRMVQAAKQRGVALWVDHTYMFHPAVRMMRKLIADGELGDRLLYYDSTRVNLGPIRRDVNALWDLAVHDLAIMAFILPGSPRAVSATGAAHLDGQPENLSYLTCFYPDNLIAHVNVNWLAPVKIRQTLLCGTEKMLVYNDLEPSEKIKIYDKNVRFPIDGHNCAILVGEHRAGDMWAPKVPAIEPLKLEVQEFVEALQGTRQFVSTGQDGVEMIRLLEAASHSMANRGAVVELDAQEV